MRRNCCIVSISLAVRISPSCWICWVRSVLIWVRRKAGKSSRAKVLYVFLPCQSFPDDLEEHKLIHVYTQNAATRQSAPPYLRPHLIRNSLYAAHFRIEHSYIFLIKNLPLFDCIGNNWHFRIKPTDIKPCIHNLKSNLIRIIQYNLMQKMIRFIHIFHCIQ